jgi:hypothetical protein
MVREDQVDIWVELTGHIGNNKLGVMACRPAPSILNKSACILFSFVFQLKDFLILAFYKTQI